MNIDVYDPWISIQDFKHEFNFEIKNDLSRLKIKKYQVIIVAVGHTEFKKIKLTKNLNQVIYDVKSFYSKEIVDARL
jgi:UDP-N-acetyl-D-mannosaminuronate dehydrogenase